MAMYQVYDALRGLTDECVSVYLGDVLVYLSTTAARRTHLWMVLDWLLEYQLHVYAMVSDFLIVVLSLRVRFGPRVWFPLVAACCSWLLAHHQHLHVQTEMASHTQSRERDAAVCGP